MVCVFPAGFEKEKSILRLMLSNATIDGYADDAPLVSAHKGEKDKFVNTP